MSNKVEILHKSLLILLKRSIQENIHKYLNSTLQSNNNIHESTKSSWESLHAD
jgi:hypothetical protein